jgi:serine/threonine-protein kinase
MVASQLSPVSPGDVIAGGYRVERIIGIGGMGIVLAARHLQLDHLVAIKFLLPKLAENKDIVGRFTREARAAVRIQNEHVARVTDVGTLGGIGVPYIVMEYLDGTDLEDFSQKSGALSIEDSVDFVLQACEAIAEAHGLGIVHRDLKPGNLFLVRRPDGSRIIKVLDFGISKVTSSPGANPVAATNTMLGSPPYMSPEQLSRPTEVDARSDIWALGVILYRFLTGRIPFDASTIAQLCAAIMHGDPPLLRDLRADVPLGLERVVLRCLEKDRANRYANVGELARDLLAYAPDRSRVSVERALHLSAGQAAMAATIPARFAASSSPSNASLPPMIETRSNFGQTSRGRPRSRRGAFVLVGAGLASAVAFGAYRWIPIFHLANETPISNPGSSKPVSQIPPQPSPSPPSSSTPAEGLSPVQAVTPKPGPADSPPLGASSAEPSPPSATHRPRDAIKPTARTVEPVPARLASPPANTEPSDDWEEQRK